jgi:DnaJ-class molecular chaperone
MLAFDYIGKNVSYKVGRYGEFDTCHGTGLHSVKKKICLKCYMFFEGLVRDKISTHYDIK